MLDVHSAISLASETLKIKLIITTFSLVVTRFRHALPTSCRANPRISSISASVSRRIPPTPILPFPHQKGGRN